MAKPPASHPGSTDEPAAPRGRPTPGAARAAGPAHPPGANEATVIQRIPSALMDHPELLEPSDEDVDVDVLVGDDEATLQGVRFGLDEAAGLGDVEELSDPAERTIMDVGAVAGLASLEVERPEPRVERAVRLPAARAEGGERSPSSVPWSGPSGEVAPERKTTLALPDPAERPAPPVLDPIAARLVEGLADPGKDRAEDRAKDAAKVERRGFGRWRVRSSGDGGPRGYRDLILAGIAIVLLGGYLLKDRGMTVLVLGDDLPGGQPTQPTQVSWRDQPVERLPPRPPPEEPPPHVDNPKTLFVAPQRGDPAPPSNMGYFDESYTRRPGPPRKTKPRHLLYTIRRGEPGDTPPKADEQAETQPGAAKPADAKPTDTKPADAKLAGATKAEGTANTPTAGAMLTIMSQPPGATVELDGQPIGKTPLVRPAPAGKTSFEVRLLLDGHKPWTGTLKPNDAGHFSLNATL